jgi:hypothetical protein
MNASPTTTHTRTLRTRACCGPGRGAAVLWFALMAVWPGVLQAQVGINADGVAPDPAAVLDINADALPANDQKGLLLPSVRLNSAFWQMIGVPPHPFLGYGATPPADMVTSLWLYNSVGWQGPTSSFQYSTTPTTYWWEYGGGNTMGNRWLRQQARVVPLHHHQTTGTITVLANNDWQTLPGLEAVSLQLRAGDRVLLSASGALTLPPPTPPSQSREYAHAGVRVRVTGSATATPVETALSLVDEAQLIQDQSCAFWVFCGGSSYIYTTKLGLQDWRLIGYYDVPADGTYTFAVQIARISGLAGVVGGGTDTVNPELKGLFSVEVIRP